MHLCRKAITFDELLAARGLTGAPDSIRRRLYPGPALGASTFVLHYDSLPDDDFAGLEESLAQAQLRKTKSAESVLCQQLRRPRIVVQNSHDESGEGVIVMPGDKEEEQNNFLDENDDSVEVKSLLESRGRSREEASPSPGNSTHNNPR